ncbi:hypothetical protein DPMN_168717 [Dreissena polymorpha]|uniref:Uncharacterized protein n=1 Tax=Dreissena polymorpha TaxID=45954 RepID=A0A9D4F634_DREPO|nr:hypothetical protein DPMN_168717 [Dreissena polymorpha]
MTPHSPRQTATSTTQFTRSNSAVLAGSTGGPAETVLGAGRKLTRLFGVVVLPNSAQLGPSSTNVVPTSQPSGNLV